jgi:hypothetical protein
MGVRRWFSVACLSSNSEEMEEASGTLTFICPLFPSTAPSFEVAHTRTAMFLKFTQESCQWCWLHCRVWRCWSHLLPMMTSHWYTDQLGTETCIAEVCSVMRGSGRLRAEASRDSPNSCRVQRPMLYRILILDSAMGCGTSSAPPTQSPHTTGPNG